VRNRVTLSVSCRTLRVRMPHEPLPVHQDELQRLQPPRYPSRHGGYFIFAGAAMRAEPYAPAAAAAFRFFFLRDHAARPAAGSGSQCIFKVGGNGSPAQYWATCCCGVRWPKTKALLLARQVQSNTMSGAGSSPVSPETVPLPSSRASVKSTVAPLHRRHPNGPTPTCQVTMGFPPPSLSHPNAA
jgi:hypothetical protein